MKQMLDYALLEVRRRRGRSLGNIGGYLIASAFLIVTVSIAGFSSRGAGAALNYTGAQFIGFIYSSPDDQQVIFNDPLHEGLFVYNYPVVPFPVELIETIRQSPHVRHAAPLLTYTIITDEYVNRSWILAGFDPSDMESVRMVSCSATEIVEGRLLVPGDSGVVLLEQTFADAEQYKIDDILYLGDKEFVVAGILSPGTRPAKADIYMPLDEAMALLNTRVSEPVRNIANVVLVDGASSLLNRSAQNDVREILGFNSSTLGYGCFNPAGAAIGVTFRGMRLLGLIIFISISLLVLSSQYWSVMERRTEIGILKSIGWSDRNVLMQVLAESFLQSAAGGAAGCILAMLLLTFLPFEGILGLNHAVVSAFDPVIVLAGFLLTIAAGAIAGTFSAFVSLRLTPAAILRRI